MESRRIETALRTAVYRRNYRRGRDRALARLSRMYPEDYVNLLNQERKKDELEGKKWNHIGDSAVPGVAKPPEAGTSANPSEGEAASDGAAETPRNVGGEA